MFAAQTVIPNMTFQTIFLNLIPLLIICFLMAFGLWKKPDMMIAGFKGFGRFMDAFTKIVFTLVVVEYFTGIFSTLFGVWPFEPIIADEADINRALEVAGLYWYYALWSISNGIFHADTSRETAGTFG
ncbi:ethanolamine utilization protein EutH [Erysipelothrix sp. D19-032]